MTSKEYYQNEIKRVIDTPTKISFKLTGWNDSTREMNLNLDSIEVLEQLLKKVKKELKSKIRL